MLNTRPNPDSEALVPTGELLTRALAAYQAAPARFQQEPPSEPAAPLTHYLWVLRKYRWQMLAFVAVCTIAAFLISSRMHRIYESTATLDVDRQTSSDIVGDQARNASPALDADQFMATQIKLIDSDSVLRPVARKYNLLDELPSANNTVRKPMSSGPVQLRRLAISRPPNTYLIQISYRSTDPVLAANVANAIAASYLEHTYEIRARSSSSLSKYMSKQLDDLRAKMERSEMALAAFEKQLNVINPEEKTSILSARLLQLNTEYTNAQADRMRKEAAFNSTESGSLESAQVATQGEALKNLTDRLNAATERFAQVKEQYGPNHPEYAKAASQVSELQRQFDSARQNVQRRTEVEFHQATNREVMLRNSVNETKAEFDRVNQNSYQYQNLKQEATADKKLYEELVGKINEASINSGFQSREVRLADAALPGDRPVSPNIPLNVILSFLFSTFIAVGGAVMADTLDKTISDPEQVTRELRTTLIGSLPMSRGWKFRVGAGDSENGAPGAMIKADQGSSKMLEESIRVLHSSIMLSDLDRRLRSILITSVSPHEGKSTTSALLASTNAQQGKKTLLIDGDMRRPSIDRFFGMSNTTGLSNVVLGEMTWRKALTPADGVPNLDVLTAGPPSHRALEMVGSAVGTLLEEALREYSLIIMDSAPMMNFAEPLQMATLVDGVVIVSVAGETNRKALGSVVTRLTRLRANVIGIVLNKVTKHMTETYDYYGYSAKYASRYYAADRQDQP